MSHLGTGGMASVYRAIHRALGIEVAFKLLPAYLGEAQVAERFRREAQAAANLDHPGCVRVLDHGTCMARSLYLTMELLAGPTLRDILRRYRAVAPRLAVEIVGGLLDALAHAHRRGIVHRDVKPENIMFGRRGDERRPVLIDFGLARVADATPLTAVGTCYGSPSYLAPERLLGRPARPGADVYAAGVVLYELLAGSRPFLGDSPMAIARSALHDDPPPLTSGSPALAAVVSRALDRDPARRFADAGEMAAALAEVAA